MADKQSMYTLVQRWSFCEIVQNSEEKKSEKVVGQNEFGSALIFEDFAIKLKAFTAIHKQGLNYLENLLDPCNYIGKIYK